MSQALSNKLLKVVDVRHLTASTYVLRLERHDVQFLAGQCVSLGIGQSRVNREYSLYSGEKDTHLEFLIRVVPGGLVSPALQKVKPGDSVTFSGPYGRFVLEAPQDTTRRYVFIGTGTGVAPYRAFVRTYPSIQYQVLHGVAKADEQYDRADYAAGTYVSCVSQEKAGDFQGRVTEFLKKNPVKPESICYLCGNSRMLAEAYDILREQGVPGNNLFTEAFF